MHKILASIPWIFLGFVSQVLSASSREARVRVVVDDWPPGFITGARTEGIIPDLMAVCSDGQGWTAAYELLPPNRARDSIANGDADLRVWSRDNYLPTADSGKTAGRKVEREQMVVFGHEPILIDTYHPVVRSSFSQPLAKYEDFDGLVIGQIGNIAPSEAFNEKIQQAKAGKRYDFSRSSEVVFNKIINQRIDVFVSSRLVFQWWVKTHGLDEAVRMIEGFHITPDAKPKPYFIAASRKSRNIQNVAGFVQAFDGCLQRLKRSGQYCQILAKYGVSCDIKSEER